jgi:hypothetical protein
MSHGRDLVERRSALLDEITSTYKVDAVDFLTGLSMADMGLGVWV